MYLQMYPVSLLHDINRKESRIPLWCIPFLPVPRLYRNLGVIPGWRAAYGWMSTDWRPEQRYWRNMENILFLRVIGTCTCIIIRWFDNLCVSNVPIPFNISSYEPVSVIYARDLQLCMVKRISEASRNDVHTLCIGNFGLVPITAYTCPVSRISLVGKKKEYASPHRFWSRGTTINRRPLLGHKDCLRWHHVKIQILFWVVNSSQNDRRFDQYALTVFRRKKNISSRSTGHGNGVLVLEYTQWLKIIPHMDKVIITGQTRTPIPCPDEISALIMAILSL